MINTLQKLNAQSNKKFPMIESYKHFGYNDSNFFIKATIFVHSNSSA